jgi:hypothetical protein
MKKGFGIHKFKNRCCCYSFRAVGSRGVRASPVFGISVNPLSTRGGGILSHPTFLPSPPPRNFRPSDSPELRYGSKDLTLIYLLINQNWKCRFRKNRKEFFLPNIKHRWHLIHRNCHHKKLITKLLLLK